MSAGPAAPVLAGLMQDWPLTLDRLLTHAAKCHAERKLVGATPEGVVRRSYAEVYARARRASAALRRAGMWEGDRIATLAMNGVAHLEAWYGIVGMGAVCHTLNPRLSGYQLARIARHAGDRMIFADRQFLPLAQTVAAQCPTIERIIVLDEAPVDGQASFNAFLRSGEGEVEWGRFSEEAAAGLCYTSGTTGMPKGVLYSHRSNFLHTLITIQPNAFALSASDTVLPVVPMYHANAWGLAYSAPAVGAALVLPGPDVGGPAIAGLVEAECVTVGFAVPTVWLGLLDHLKASGRRLPSLRRVVVGGAACSERMMRDFAAFGIEAVPAWGMTELSPVGTVCSLPPELAARPFDEQVPFRVKQGRALCGTEMRIVGPSGEPLAHDGRTHGHLRVRGPGVARAYYGDGDIIGIDDDGYFDTGDIATIDSWGAMQITDRARDMIKSGGEWISPSELETAAQRHPGVGSAAVIGVPDRRWDERPLLFAQRVADADVDADEVIAFLGRALPRWMVPSQVVFVDEMPLGATGKIDKKALRTLYETL